jgi:hypothetical protein
MKSTSPLWVVYYGGSMNPTLCELEMMEVLPYHGRAIRVGDVILFHASGRGDPVVHRVVAITLRGVQTHGDNSPIADEWILQTSDVIGQVVAAWRGARRRRLSQGWRGHARARWWHILRPVRSFVVHLFHAPYYWLVKLGFPRRIFPAKWLPYRATFQVGEGQIQRMLLGNRVIGEYDSRRGEWQIQRPFRLLIDPHDLEMDT